MAQFIEEKIRLIKKLWNNSTLPQKILYSGLVASFFVVGIVLFILLNSTNYKVLYSNLYPEDAARVVEVLKKQKVPYKLANNGNTILVPEDKVYSLRLMIAGKGVLHGQGVGFEIFDSTRIGQTDFVQKINYQRALQGELERTIAEFDEVESARVHLVLPQKSLFIEENEPPSASVVLTLKPGASLSKEQVRSIVNLITTGVEGMTPDRITISDTRGRILYEPKQDIINGLSSTQLEYKLSLERTLEQRIEDLLAPIVGGRDKVIARVSADIDFSRKTIHKELYDPNVTVVRSEQKTEEESKGTTNLQTGSPEPAYRGSTLSGTGTTQQTSRTSSITNYEINKEEQQIIAPVGEIRRLSVAVVVDGQYVKNAKGEYVYKPLPKEVLDQIRGLVEKAVGYDSTRGDQIEVTNLAFGKPEQLQATSWLQKALQYFQIVGKPLLNTVIILLFLLLVVRPVVMAILKPEVVEEEVEEVEELPEGEPKLALEELSPEEREALEMQKRIEDQTVLAKQLVSEDFERAFRVLKMWLKEEEA
ncbi:MAG: flagellar basal-body MS-ring/collar protein FliF [Desulfonauticus sp.]|nr:flagellar basal-body MS-ring/collar protein FliF [Desulfonauticus sp.]